MTAPTPRGSCTLLYAGGIHRRMRVANIKAANMPGTQNQRDSLARCIVSIRMAVARLTEH